MVKYCGGVYLIWLGIGLFNSKLSLTVNRNHPPKVSLIADFFAGLFLTLGDVKAILFYASLFPVLVDMQQVGFWEALIVGGVTVAAVGGVKLAYVVFASKIAESLRGQVSSDIPQKIGGALMIGCGSALIVKA